MNLLTLQAPAKLNLSLRVIAKRADGFHEIETFMVKLPGLADELRFRKGEEFSFHCDDTDIPSDESNLVVKAVRSYQQATGQPCHYSLNLRKSIPHGAGLGGGSSDAAAALLGLNLLHNDALAANSLFELAARIGSDVPFFMRAGAAICTGRGEKIQQVPCPPPLGVMLFKPKFNVSTPDAYQRWKHSAEIPGIPYSPQSIAGISFFNDLERPVFQKHRFLAELKHWLLSRSDITTALMSGSGSTIFAVLTEGAQPELLAEAARHTMDPNLWIWHGGIECKGTQGD